MCNIEALFEISYKKNLPGGKWQGGELNGFGTSIEDGKTFKGVFVDGQRDMKQVDPEGMVTCSICYKRGKPKSLDNLDGFNKDNSFGIYLCSKECEHKYEELLKQGINVLAKQQKETLDKIISCSWCSKSIKLRDAYVAHEAKCSRNVNGDDAAVVVTGYFCSNKCMDEWSCKECKEANYLCK